MFEKLLSEVNSIGKPLWRPMLTYVTELHARSVHSAEAPFLKPWEEIGPGYGYGPAFGHWDLTHALLDTLPTDIAHAKNQIENHLGMQLPNGMLPAVIYMNDPKPHFSKDVTHPPVWPKAVQVIYQEERDQPFLAFCYNALLRQLSWFEENRKAVDGGYYYMDILNNLWESGVDEGIRFIDIATGAYSCVDATAQVYMLLDFAARWAEELAFPQDAQVYRQKASELATFIQTRLYDEETSFFHDIWAVNQPQKRTMAFEGMWPVVVGAATPQQATKVIDENLLNPDRFFTQHPIASVGAKDPRFELRCWRGPTWNSMTLWAALGCMRYGRNDAAARLLERALDASAVQFEQTGCIWEFYHPHGGSPKDLQRKPHRVENMPFTDYLGHNPLIAMARLWDETSTLLTQV